MTDRRDVVVGLGWGDLRERAPAAPRDETARDEPSELHRTSAAWWPRAAVHELCVREGAEVWLHVVSGDVELERWSRGDDGAWRATPLRLRAGASERLGPDALHRAQARHPSNVLVVCSPPDAIATDAAAPSLAMLRHGRDAFDGDVLVSTAVGTPCARLGGDEDA
jgi:hypothetical protein